MLKFQNVLRRNELQVNWHVLENIMLRNFFLVACYTSVNYILPSHFNNRIEKETYKGIFKSKLFSLTQKKLFL